MRSLCFVALMSVVGMSPALAGDALSWLHRMNQASRSTNFAGIYVYESGGRSESARITHVTDGSGQQERLESLDGAPREVIRFNDEVKTFLPNERLVVIDRAATGSFPGRLVAAMGGLSDFYVIRMGETGKVATRDAQAIRLEPRDDMRYGHELWADVGSGLLLKARMLKSSAEVIEQFAYSEIQIGPQVDREKVKARYSRGSDWKVVNARGVDLRPEEAGWAFNGLPPGFRQISLSRRPIRKDAPEALHAVFSDGLASVSVFIEPGGGRSVPPTQNLLGPVSMYRSTRADAVVTAVGEVPPAALKRIAEGVTPANPPPAGKN
ncbi:MAG: MucB/RseB C-terminal domain-containing protein [Rhodocyclaceae bacterium]